jgi:hypothetical protein
VGLTVGIGVFPMQQGESKSVASSRLCFMKSGGGLWQLIGIEKPIGIGY